MYLPEKPKAPVTAIRTLAFHQAEKITHSARYRNALNGWLFPATGKNGNERARLATPTVSCSYGTLPKSSVRCQWQFT